MRDWWWKAAIAGFVATLVMTFASLPFQAEGPSATALLWAQVTGVDAVSAQAAFIGLFLHFLYGTVVGVLFAALVVLAAVPRKWFLWGLAWGVVLWLASAVLWTPLVVRTAPLLEGAVAFLVVNLLLHLVYGGVLGGILAWWAPETGAPQREGRRAPTV